MVTDPPTNTPTQRQDRLQFTAPQLARRVITVGQTAVAGLVGCMSCWLVALGRPFVRCGRVFITLVIIRITNAGNARPTHVLLDLWFRIISNVMQNVDLYTASSQKPLKRSIRQNISLQKSSKAATNFLTRALACNCSFPWETCRSQRTVSVERK